jgi:hypothetical protein
LLYNQDITTKKNQEISTQEIRPSRGKPPVASIPSIVLLRKDQKVNDYATKNKLIEHARSQIEESVKMWDFEVYELNKMPLERRNRKDYCIKYVLVYTRDKNFEYTDGGWVDVGYKDIQNWYSSDLTYLDGVCIQNQWGKGYPRNLNYFETKSPINPKYKQDWCN